MTVVIRPPLTDPDRRRGERLGRVLREARGARSIVDVAAAAGVSAETLRKIETGRVPTPAFFTVAALAEALRLPLDVLAARCEEQPVQPQRAAPGQQIVTRLRTGATGPASDSAARTSAVAAAGRHSRRRVASASSSSEA